MTAYNIHPEPVGILVAHAAPHFVVISIWSRQPSIQAAKPLTIGLTWQILRSSTCQYLAAPAGNHVGSARGIDAPLERGAA